MTKVAIFNVRSVAKYTVPSRSNRLGNDISESPASRFIARSPFRMDHVFMSVATKMIVSETIAHVRDVVLRPIKASSERGISYTHPLRGIGEEGD